MNREATRPYNIERMKESLGPRAERDLMLEPHDGLVLLVPAVYARDVVEALEQMQREHAHHHIPGSAACAGCARLGRLGL